MNFFRTCSHVHLELDFLEFRRLRWMACLASCQIQRGNPISDAYVRLIEEINSIPLPEPSLAVFLRRMPGAGDSTIQNASAPPRRW